MTNECNGKCYDNRAEQLGYGGSAKYCSICHLFLLWDGNHCPCCKTKLRWTKRGPDRRKNSGKMS